MGTELRHWIDLVENTPSGDAPAYHALFDNKAAFYDRLVQKDTAENGGGDDAFVTPHKFDVAYRRLHRLRGSQAIPIYRVMQLRPEMVKGFKAGCSLGQSWAFCYIPDNINEYDQFDPSMRKQPWFLLEARIAFANIDLETTLYLNCMFPHEWELRPAPTAPCVTFVSIRALDASDKPYGKNLRPDLAGTMFLADDRKRL